MSTSLTKEQLRNARLAALGISSEGGNPPSATLVEESVTQKVASVPSALIELPFSEGDLSDLQRIIYKGGYATDEDMLRWYDQGFRFCSEPFFGLQQGNGGPCGILATIQAEILREMIFGSNSESDRMTLPSAGEVDVHNLLAAAACAVLARAAEGGSVQLFYIPESSQWKPMSEWRASDVIVTAYESLTAAKEAAARPEMQALWRSGLGCVAFLASLICSRGVQRIASDMDDSSSTLIGQFGHCNQDLINLLLTGRATSNVIDGEMELGDSGLKLRGVYQRNRIGYLTQLEALRYCEVGSYLKVPEFPIWVVGSSSHFSVLFSLQRPVNEESRAQKLRSTLQRCFKAVDRAECGFIPASSLREALEQINLHGDYAHNPILAVLNNETDLARLRGHLQIDGEIILWSAFWVNLSSLMSGKPLDELIGISPENSNMDALIIPEDTAMDTGGGGRVRSDSEMARELQAELNGEVYVPPAPSGSKGTGTSSSSGLASGIAQPSGVKGGGTSALDFSALLGGFNQPTTSSSSSSAAPVSTTWGTPARPHPSTAFTAPAPIAGAKPDPPVETRMRSDSDIARELQAQWDAEEAFPSYNEDNFASIAGGTTTRQKHSLSMDVNTGHPGDLIDDLPDLVPLQQDAYGTPSKKAHLGDDNWGYVGKMPADSVGAAGSSAAADFPQETVERYEMHHFNGLESAGRTARLTTFQLIVRSAADNVGVSVAFEGGEHHQGGGFNSPLEEVLRTRWPACTVDWQGQPPPSID